MPRAVTHKPFRRSHEIFVESFPWLRLMIFAAVVTIAALCYAGWDYYRHIPHATSSSDDLNDTFNFPIPAPTVTADP